MALVKNLILAVLVVLIALVAPYYLHFNVLQKLYVKYNLMPPIPRDTIDKFCQARIGSNSVDKLDEGVYVGDICAAVDPLIVETREITRIVNTCFRCPNALSSKSIEYLQLNLREELEEGDEDEVVEALAQALKFIHTARKQGRKVLVHDVAGQIQAMAVSVAYLIQHKRFDLGKSLKMLQDFRPATELSPRFVDALRRFERSQISL